MTSLYDLAISGLSFSGASAENNISAESFVGSGVVATDYTASGVTTALQGNTNFSHSIDQSIEGDKHTFSITIAPENGVTFSASIPSTIEGWDGTTIDVNAIQFDFGNFYRGQWGDVVEGFGEVDGIDVDLPWIHADSSSIMELTYADGFTHEVVLDQADEFFPEAMDQHTEHDELNYVPTIGFDLTDPETGRRFGDAVSVTFKETVDVPENIESNGEIRLYKDGSHIHVQDASGDWHDVLTSNGKTPGKLLDRLASRVAGWQLASAETIDGVNELLFTNEAGTKSRIFHCDEDWDLNGESTKAFKKKKHQIEEDEHQIDFNGDGSVAGSQSYALQVFYAGANVDPDTESISFVASAPAASDSGTGKAVSEKGKTLFVHSVEETLEGDTLIVEQTVSPRRDLTFFESVPSSRSLTSWDGTVFSPNALQFDFGNYYNGQWGIGEVNGIDIDLPWDHADATSSYTLTFEDGSTQEITHEQSSESFAEGGVADWDELHFAPLFAFDLPATSDLDGLKLGDAVSVTFTESFKLADVVEDSGSIKTAMTPDGGTYVLDEDNVWHDITGAADEITNHLGLDDASSSRSILDPLLCAPFLFSCGIILAGAETINGVNQLVYSVASDISGALSRSSGSHTISVVANDLWDVVSGSATTIAHDATNAINDLEDAFGIDIDKNSVIGAITDLF